MQGNYGDPHEHPGSSMTLSASSLGTMLIPPNTLFRIWVLSVLVNSLFSFWWDVTNDFGLHILLPPRATASPSSLLRRTLLLPDPLIYYLIISLDFVLRFTWSLKLSSHLHGVHEMEMGIFILEALEVLRRWLWVFVRVEWEAVRKGGDVLEERMRNNPSGISLPLLLPTLQGGVPAVALTGSTGSGGVSLDRRISANHRKTGSKSGLEDEAQDVEMVLGRSGILVDVPRTGKVDYQG